jgi:uncharacterized protein (UPF0332 family)
VKAEAHVHLARADEVLKVAGEILRLGYPADSIGRSYYAAFHAATAVLLELGIARSSHHGVWAAFGQFVTAKGLMDAEHHRTGTRLFRSRIRSDYHGAPGMTQENAEAALDMARAFVAACRRALLTDTAGGEDPK